MGALSQPHKDTSLGAILDAADIMQLRKFTRDEFYAMERAGIFDNETRVELIDGRIINDTAAVGGSHGWSVERLTRLLVRATEGTEYSVRVQSGVSLPDDRELQPDFALYKPTAENATHNPTVDQIILVAEIADSSLLVDRTYKMQLYAEAKGPVYWVVDVAHKRVFVHQAPEDGIYSSLEQFSGDDQLEVCGHSIRVGDMF